MKLTSCEDESCCCGTAAIKQRHQPSSYAAEAAYIELIALRMKPWCC